MWTKTTIEDQHHDDKVENNVSRQREESLEIVQKLEEALDTHHASGHAHPDAAQAFALQTKQHESEVDTLRKELSQVRAALGEAQRCVGVCASMHEKLSRHALILVPGSLA